MTRIQRYICEIYSRVQLESIGFRFGKCARDKKITLLTEDTLKELLNNVPRGIIIIIPNRDLSSDFAIINDANVDASYENSSIEELGHNRHNRLVIRRHSLQTQPNSRQESSNNESDDNYQDMQDYNMRNRQIIRKESVDTQILDYNKITMNLMTIFKMFRIRID